MKKSFIYSIFVFCFFFLLPCAHATLKNQVSETIEKSVSMSEKKPHRPNFIERWAMRRLKKQLERMPSDSKLSEMLRDTVQTDSVKSGKDPKKWSKTALSSLIVAPLILFFAVLLELDCAPSAVVTFLLLVVLAFFLLGIYATITSIRREGFNTRNRIALCLAIIYLLALLAGNRN